MCSEKGWIRALRGHLSDTSELRYKEGDGGRFVFHAETTDRLLIFASNGRFYTLGVDKLPGGRGQGEPLRLMIDLAGEHEAVAIHVVRPGCKYLIASSDGRGFIVPGDEAVAQTRAGRQVLNLAGTAKACVCIPAEGDAIAVIGENRKLLVFMREELPEMSRGRGVILQKYKDGGLGDATIFTLSGGLVCQAGGRSRTFTDIELWLGKRAQSGRLPPTGFPRSNRFA